MSGEARSRSAEISSQSFVVSSARSYRYKTVRRRTDKAPIEITFAPSTLLTDVRNTLNTTATSSGAHLETDVNRQSRLDILELSAMIGNADLIVSAIVVRVKAISSSFVRPRRDKDEN